MLHIAEDTRNLLRGRLRKDIDVKTTMLSRSIEIDVKSSIGVKERDQDTRDIIRPLCVFLRQCQWRSLVDVLLVNLPLQYCENRNRRCIALDYTWVSLDLICSTSTLSLARKMQLTCRFYKNRLPETDDLVMVNVVNIEEMGVYVNLLEYNNTEGEWIVFFSCSRAKTSTVCV